ncbi:MAG: hypothetical protein ACO3LT_01425, partial [Ilumatobacteraceae bacterium]
QQLGLAVGLFLCNTKGKPVKAGCPFTELQMERLQIQFDRSKLCPWYFAVSWGLLTLQQLVTQRQAKGFSTDYDKAQLASLVDLEQFLKMTWDEELGISHIDQTAQEVK